MTMKSAEETSELAKALVLVKRLAEEGQDEREWLCQVLPRCPFCGSASEPAHEGLGDLGVRCSNINCVLNSIWMPAKTWTLRAGDDTTGRYADALENLRLLLHANANTTAQTVPIGDLIEVLRRADGNGSDPIPYSEHFIALRAIHAMVRRFVRAVEADSKPALQAAVSDCRQLFGCQTFHSSPLGRCPECRGSLEAIIIDSRKGPIRAFLCVECGVSSLVEKPGGPPAPHREKMWELLAFAETKAAWQKSVDR